MKRFTIRAVSLLVFSVLVTTGPALPDPAARQACVRWTPLTGSSGFHLNCDSPTFLRLARDPAGLFGFPGIKRQNRPIYVFLGAALAFPLGYLAPSLGWPLPDGLAVSWWAYVLINFAIVLAAVCIFDALVGPGGSLTVAAFVFGSWLIVNDVVKQFIWSPHTQLLNILIPVVAVAASKDGLERRPTTSTRAWTIGFLLGLGTLAYGSCVIACGAYIASLWLRRWFMSPMPSRREALWQSFVTLGAYVAPIIAWVSYVWFRTGGFSSHEVQSYRQFVWIQDALRQGLMDLVRAFAANIGFFLPTVASSLWLPVAALCALVAAAWYSGVPLQVVARGRRELLVATTLVFGSTLSFLALLGFYAERLSWALVPPLLVVCVILGDTLEVNLRRFRRNMFRAGMVVILLIGVAVEVRSGVPPLQPGSPVQAAAWASRTRTPSAEQLWGAPTRSGDAAGSEGRGSRKWLRKKFR